MVDEPCTIIFSGPSGSGKTTLVERLVARLRAEGVRVGAVKRSSHALDLDSPGKDSWRLRQAGACPVALVSDGYLVYQETSPEPFALGEVVRFFRGKVDIILVEGYKAEPAPPRGGRFVVTGPEGAASGEEGVLGYIIPSGAKAPGGAEVFSRDDVEGLAKWILGGFPVR